MALPLEVDELVVEVLPRFTWDDLEGVVAVVLCFVSEELLEEAVELEEVVVPLRLTCADISMEPAVRAIARTEAIVSVNKFFITGRYLYK